MDRSQRERVEQLWPAAGTGDQPALEEAKDDAVSCGSLESRCDGGIVGPQRPVGDQGKVELGFPRRDAEEREALESPGVRGRRTGAFEGRLDP